MRQINLSFSLTSTLFWKIVVIPKMAKSLSFCRFVVSVSFRNKISIFSLFIRSLISSSLLISLLLTFQLQHVKSVFLLWIWLSAFVPIFCMLLFSFSSLIGCLNLPWDLDFESGLSFPPIKPFIPAFGYTNKKHFFTQICLNFLASSYTSAFYVKNVEKAVFNNRLKCTAPKCWSKYTTNN